MLLGDVGEVQEVREGAGDRQRLVDRQARELGAPGSLEVACSRRPGRSWRRARTRLDGLKHGSPSARERVAEKFAQQPHIVAQRLVRIGGSGHEGKCIPPRVASILARMPAQPPVRLWPGAAPGALGTAPEDRPKLTLYRAPAATANGTGRGGLSGRRLPQPVADHEGQAGRGVAQHARRLRLRAAVPGRAPLSPSGTAGRTRSGRCGSSARGPGTSGRSDRLGIMGFSAGGHLAATAGTHVGRRRAGRRRPHRPHERAARLHGAGLSRDDDGRPLRAPRLVRHLLGETPDPRLVEDLSNERRVTARTPPAFLFHTAEDTGGAGGEQPRLHPGAAPGRRARRAARLSRGAATASASAAPIPPSSPGRIVSPAGCGRGGCSRVHRRPAPDGGRTAFADGEWRWPIAPCPPPVTRP